MSLICRMLQAKIDASLDEPAGDESTLIRTPAKIEATPML